jgi:L-amino acid N-acyltransferase YncA
MESTMSGQTQAVQGFPVTEKFGRHTITLKLARPEDGASVEQALLKFTQSLPAADLVFVRVDITQPDVVREWMENIQRGRTITILAEENGEIVGYANLHFSRANWTRHIGEGRLLVSAKLRGLGLGERLTDELVKLARAKGLQRIVANISATQPRVRAMFERLDFIPQALLTDWLKDRNHQKHDMIIMSRDIVE